MRKAFTLLELVFVIVIIGILAAVIIPRTTSNTVAEKTIELLSQIKNTQHLAMIDDKYSNVSTWMRNKWQITINGNEYSVVSDNNTTFAKNSMNNGKDIQNIELNGVTVTLSGSCADETDISFDHQGRPYVGEINDDTNPHEQLMTSTCIITLSDESVSSIIHIIPETGYASIQ